MLVSETDIPYEWLVEWNRMIFRCMYITVAFAAVVIFQANLKQPDAIVFSVAVVALLVLGVYNTFLRCRAKLRESINAGVVAAMIILGYAHLVYIEDYGTRVRTQGIFVVLFYVVGFVVALRLVMRLVVFSVGLVAGISAVFILNRKFDDPWTIAQMSTYFLYLAIFFTLSTVFMRRLILFYAAQQELAAEKAAVEDLLCMTCDSKIWLAPDGETIVRSDKVLEEELRKRRLEGRALSDACLPDGEEERSRVSDAIDRSKQMPVLLPTTVCSKSGKHISVELLIVSRQLQTSGAAFLIGIRFDKSSFEDEPSEIPERSLKPIVARHQSPSTASAPSTSPSGVALDNFANSAKNGDVEQMKEDLGDFTETGLREHWLIDFAKLDFGTSCVLGVGGFGLVLSATLHGTRVAVKVCREAQQHDNSGVALLLREIRVMRYIRHPNLVLLHGACIDVENTEIGLIFERLDGVGLDKFADHIPVTPVEVCNRFRVAVDVVRALRFLHSQEPPIVHMDLKDSNVQVTELGCRCRAKLIDFGLSCLVTRRCVANGGTVNWAAPELICFRSNRPTPSADIFSYGRLLFMLVTGEVPLAHIGQAAIMNCVHNRKVPPLQWPDGDVPFRAELSDICSRYCCFDASARPTTVKVEVEIKSLLRVSLRNSGETDEDEIQAGAEAEVGAPSITHSSESVTFSQAVSIARASLSKKPIGGCFQPNSEETATTARLSAGSSLFSL